MTRGYCSDLARAIWKSLPVSGRSKTKFKELLFRVFPFAFGRTLAYQAWKLNGDSYGRVTLINADPTESQGNELDPYLPTVETRPPAPGDVRLICLYLPQFHAIPENDRWWGAGFTEWTNVAPAYPQFPGHYQPHIPGELGYYDLLNPAVMKRQVELANLYGVGGFCFYFYWFDGKRLLETPIENFANDASLNLPYCLCWANENWSRRWDGLDSETLIEQNHSPEDDLAFIRYIGKYLRDSRYIRVGQKPLLVVYRPHLLPSARDTARRWRVWCRENGIGEIYLAYTQSFEMVDPATYEFDAAIEFPPNNSGPPNLTNTIEPYSKAFAGKVFDWRIFKARSQAYRPSSYKLLRAVCPSWDNTARRKERGTSFRNSTPRDYQDWLSNAVKETRRVLTIPDERMVFINAWNEWAEGAHLEPDLRYGYAWLQATRNALTGENFQWTHKRRLILVTHDAYPHGAQLLVLNLAKELNQNFGFKLDLVCLGAGPLRTEFAKWATVWELHDKSSQSLQARGLAEKLFQAGHRKALVNTTVSGLFLKTLSEGGIECVALIHELRGVIEQSKLHMHAAAIAQFAKQVVFPAKQVAEAFNAVARCDEGKVVIRPQGLYKRRKTATTRSEDRIALRKRLGFTNDTAVVLAMGFADHRKGVDLFVEAGVSVAAKVPHARWVWVGHWDAGMQAEIETRLSRVPEIKSRFVFPGLQKETDVFFGGADVFVLSSREDPFPSVVLEAMDAGIPLVGFEGASGCQGLFTDGCGVLVPQNNSGALGAAVASLLENPEHIASLGRCGRELIQERFSFREYLFDLLEISGMGFKKISVVVPNYNYANYLPERIHSILAQDYPVFEVIFLDDCSTDDSVKVATKLLHESGVRFSILVNETNSGSVFRQWQKGVALAQGSHVWIAEADDCCEPNMLSNLVRAYDTPGVVMSYCESQQIDETGAKLSDNYLAYVSDVDERRWLSPFVMQGERAAANLLSIKNTIPNVSAVLFDRQAINATLATEVNAAADFKVAGDWYIYLRVLATGSLAFTNRPLNKHRRHKQGVTISNVNQAQLDEIRRMQETVGKTHQITDLVRRAGELYLQRLRIEHKL